MKVLMVCMGNICRSPMAEGILRHKCKIRNLNINVDSAGFESFHSGDSPDRRAIYTVSRYGIDISAIRSRVFQYEDFEKFDKIYVMDTRNYRDVMRVARTEEDKSKVDFILNNITPDQNEVVPDPYYGGDSGFENVFYLLDKACESICNNL